MPAGYTLVTAQQAACFICNTLENTSHFHKLHTPGLKNQQQALPVPALAHQSVE